MFLGSIITLNNFFRNFLRPIRILYHCFLSSNLFSIHNFCTLCNGLAHTSPSSSKAGKAHLRRGRSTKSTEKIIIKSATESTTKSTAKSTTKSTSKSIKRIIISLLLSIIRILLLLLLSLATETTKTTETRKEILFIVIKKSTSKTSSSKICKKTLKNRICIIERKMVMEILKSTLTQVVPISVVLGSFLFIRKNLVSFWNLFEQLCSFFFISFVFVWMILYCQFSVCLFYLFFRCCLRYS